MTPTRERTSSWRGLVILLLVSCGGAQGEAVGVSTGGASFPPAPSASASASSDMPRWTHAAAVRTWPKANAHRFVSTGHLFGRWDADVHVNAIAEKGYATIAPGKALEVGAIVAKVHSPHGAEGVGPIFAMEKRDDGWTYLELDEKAGVRRSGRLHPCIDCHAHVSSQDELFGVPTTGK